MFLLWYAHNNFFFFINQNKIVCECTSCKCWVVKHRIKFVIFFFLSSFWLWCASGSAYDWAVLSLCAYEPVCMCVFRMFVMRSETVSLLNIIQIFWSHVEPTDKAYHIFASNYKNGGHVTAARRVIDEMKRKRKKNARWREKWAICISFIATICSARVWVCLCIYFCFHSNNEHE